MRALLDVNVIIALLDANHAFHERAHAWWAANARRGWQAVHSRKMASSASWPIRNYSQKNPVSAGDLIARLREFAGRTNHEFWADEISLR